MLNTLNIKSFPHAPADFANDVASFEKVEPLVQFHIVNVIVVTLGQHKLVGSRRILGEPAKTASTSIQSPQSHHQRVLFRLAGCVAHEYVVRLENTMYDRNICIRHLVHCNVPSLIPCIGRVGQEEKVATVEGRFHGPTVTTSTPHLARWRDPHLSTTTIGDSVLKKSPRPFHSIKPDAITDAKLSICRRT